MTAEPWQENNTIERSLASLHALIAQRGHDPAVRPSPLSTAEIRALKQLFADERTRLSGSTGPIIATVQQIMKALRLNRAVHEINTFAETESRDMIACVFAQAETFIERYGQNHAPAMPDTARRLATLSQRLRVKSQTLHQLPCTPATTLKRVALIQQYLNPAARILCLGDDDFVSVALAQTVPNDITVLELDPQVIKLIEHAAAEQPLRIRCRKTDIRQPVPEEFRGSFDVVVTDPIYSIKEMLSFLSAAEVCLRKAPTSYLLSCGSRMVAGNAWGTVEAWAASRGLVVHEFFPGFNEYLKTARIRILLRLMARLLFHSSVIRACFEIPFLYSDLVVFRFQPTEKRNTT
jgi:hypothetical protein